jgi:hypothetical protein
MSTNSTDEAWVEFQTADGHTIDMQKWPGPHEPGTVIMSDAPAGVYEWAQLHPDPIGGLPVHIYKFEPSATAETPPSLS